MFKKKLKSGAYSVALAVIAIAAVVLINMIVGKLPSTCTKLDVSDEKLFTMGEQTEEIVSGITEDITIYLLTQEGAEDSTLVELLNRYEALSDHIKVETKDPVMYPDFIGQYTETQLSDNSILVVGENHSRAIDYYDIYQYEYDYYSYSSTLTGFDGEGQITSAIAYVTSEDIPVIYAVGGHQEMELSSTMQASIEKENMEVRTLNLLTSEAVPEDAKIVLLYAPLTDVSEDEKNKLLDYLQGGGHMLWITGYTEAETPNLDALLAEYGLEKQPGFVIEEDSNYHIPNYPHYLLPDVASTDVTANVAGRYVLAPLAQGLTQLDEVRDTITITELLSTSLNAFAKVDVNSSSMERAEEDIDGPFVLGAAITETAGAGTEETEAAQTRLVIFSSEYLLDEQMDTVVSGANTELVMGAISWLSDHEVTVSIPSKSLDGSYLTVTSSSAIFWGFLVTIILPVCLLVGGGMVCYTRRKK
ncbi:MAG: GldG family protein [Lachnospiraceae bacterium]|nr:GldG family protein [Lachnospiraceae bacterium]